MGGTGAAGGVTLGWAAATDVGLDRTVNEDSLLAELPVFLVADGMGGHQAGDVASSLVVDEFESLADGRLRNVDDVIQTIEAANASILDEGVRSDTRTGMGTTAVGLLLVDNGDRSSWMLFNIGDSRAYRLAAGRLEQLSVDHSYVQELLDAGEITVRTARNHPHRNVVTRALGATEFIHPDFWLRPPMTGERYLLCSDGLSSEIGDADILDILGEPSAERAAEMLIARALDAGGHDNITVLVVDVLSVDADQDLPPGDTAPREEILAARTAVELIDGVPDQDDLSTRHLPAEPDHD